MAKIETIGLIINDPTKQNALKMFVDIAASQEFRISFEKMLSENIGRDIKMTFDTSFDSRSNLQNRFLHGCILPAFMRCYIMLGVPGITSIEYVKEVMLKKPFLTVNKGQPDEYARGTSSLSVGDFWTFCNQCLELLVTIGGGLNDRETREYLQIVERFHLNKAVDDTIKKM